MAYCKIALLCSVTTLLFTATAVQAQSTSATADSRMELDEIVVTAQKRSEPLQDVPIAVQAFSADTVAAFGATRSEDLQALVPGMTFTQSLASSAPFLRGVGSSYSSAGAESPVAFYVDDVYRSSTAAAFFSLQDIQSIEVLKGPQGTLFGRNATGGVVNVATRDPGQEFAAKASLDYGNYQRVEGAGYLSGPLGANVTASVTANYVDQGGFGRNVVTGDEAFYHQGKLFGGKLKFKLGDTSLRLAGDWSRDVDQNGVVLLYFPGSVNNITRTALYAGDYNPTGEANGETTNTQYGASLRTDTELAWGTIRTITAYRNTDLNVDRQDGDRTALFRSIRSVATSARAVTEEIQLLSPAAGRVQWIAGAFLMDEISKYEYPKTQLITFSPARTQFADTRQDTRSYALFGQTTLPLNASTRLTAGLRQTRDKRDASDRQLFVPVTGATTQTTGAAAASWSKLTWRAALDHKFGEDVMGYVSYSRGFKSGLFNLSPFNANPVNPETLDSVEIGLKSILFDRRLRLNAAAYHYDYKDMQVQGNTTINNVTFNILFNAASATINGFDADAEFVATDRMRVRAGIALVDGQYDQLLGAPFATRNAATVGGNTVTSVAQYGLELFRTPKLSGNLLLTYAIPTSIGAVTLATGVSYSSEYFFEAAHLVRQAPLSTVNASVAWSDDQQRWSARLWGRNLGDSLRLLSANAIANGDLYSPGAPRSYGVSIARAFR